MKTFSQILKFFFFNFILFRLSSHLHLARLPDLLPPGQQRPSAVEHGGGGLQRPAVRRHQAVARADLRLQTGLPHRRGLGRREGGAGGHDRTQR